MSLPSSDQPSKPGPPSQTVPILCLLGVVALLSLITPTIKYVFQQSHLTFLGLAFGRVAVGFVFLAVGTACLDWRGLRGIRVRDCVPLGLVGFLGVGAYAVAAWGLQYTSVTHYALVYSLLPTFTTLFSYVWGKDRSYPITWFGILLSWGAAPSPSLMGCPSSAFNLNSATDSRCCLLG